MLAKSQADASKAPATITMKLGKKGPYFTGASDVRAGHNLRIVNGTAPSKIGPHTFSLVTKSALPTTAKEQKNCYPGGICGDVGKAHQVDDQGENPKLRVVAAGKAGWDRRFDSKHHKGDSWYTDKKGAAFKQKVSAKAGSTLYYFCAVHPEMHGKIKVLASH